MERNKRDRSTLVLLALPFVLLAAYALDIPFFLPSFALPQRSYLALSSRAGLEKLAEARGRGESFAILPGRLRPMPEKDDLAGLERISRELPDIPSLEPALADLQAGIGLRKARIVAEAIPSAAEITELGRISAAGGASVSIEVLPPAGDIPLLAVERRYSPKETERRVELLLSPEARGYARIAVNLDAGTEAGGKPGEGRLLYSAAGADLPPDLALRLRASEGARALELAFVDRSGRQTSRILNLGGELSERPRVLVISEKKNLESYVEKLYPSERASPAEAAVLDLNAFELVVLDGLPLASIKGSLLRGLLEVSRRRTGSLLFVADSPEFGTKGANPELEALLPAVLLPRSLKDLPDLAVLVLVDASGSMFGDKLSLAKVTGLELLRALKPGDLVGLGLFSDRRKWLYGFSPASGLDAAPALEPLSAGGGTDLHAALSEGLDRLSRAPIKQRHAVLITDGVTKPADFGALVERARSMGATISAMGVGEDADRPFLERLALGAGGRYYPVASADAIPSLIFEDRANVARPAFATGRIPVLSLGGDRAAYVYGMAQYSPAPDAQVLFASELGDPLLASRESGNRAVLLFASDLYGSYTSDFFARAETAGAFKDRLDALFAERPAEVSVTETAGGVCASIRSDELAAPRLLLSRPGFEPLEAAFRRVGDSGWAADLAPPAAGEWSAAILDRGSSTASFPIVVDGGMAGSRADAAAALEAYRPRAFSKLRSAAAWLVLFFAASLASTIALRGRR